MAHARMDRKGFLKGLGVAAAALVARPVAKAATPLIPARENVKPVADLPMKVRPQPHTIARPSEGSSTR